MKRFTDTWLRNLKPKEKLYEYREGDGFSVRIQPSGTKTFYYIYADAGKKQRVRIGEYGAMSLLEAREKAASLHREDTLVPFDCGSVFGERLIAVDDEHILNNSIPEILRAVFEMKLSLARFINEGS